MDWNELRGNEETVYKRERGEKGDHDWDKIFTSRVRVSRVRVRVKVGLDILHKERGCLIPPGRTLRNASSTIK